VRICVIDGQGGGIGAALIKRLKEVYREEHEVIALGTNAVATAQMMKARANRGASGENAIVRTVARVDVIMGPLSIVLANSMMGELTPRMAEAVSSSPAPKLLLPLTQEKVEIAGLVPEPLPHLVEKLVSERLKEYMNHV
jgi:NAD(P)-dependent dehydrogenase (short-subunit alcohol dehydrogenase family)